MLIQLIIYTLGFVYPIVWLLTWMFGSTNPGDFAERFLFSIIFTITGYSLNTIDTAKRQNLVHFSYLLLFAITYHSIYRMYTSVFQPEYMTLSFLVFLLSCLAFSNKLILLGYIFASFVGNLIASAKGLQGSPYYNFIIPMTISYIGIYIVLKRRIEQKDFLLLTEDQIKKYFWESKDGIILTDDELRIQYLNQNAKSIVDVGFREDFLIGSKIVFPTSELEQKLSLSTKIQLLGDNHIEVKYVKAEWMGEPNYLIITKNITQEVKAEREYKRISTLHARVLKHTGEGILLMDTDGLVTYANPEALRLLEIEEHQLIGEFLPLVIHETSTEGTSVEEENFPVRSTYSEGIPCYVTFDLFWRKDGSYFFVEYQATPVYEGEALIGAVMIFRDVSKRKMKEDDAKRYADEILHLSNTSSKFLEIYTEPELYRYIAYEVSSMSDDSCVIVNSYDPINNMFITKSTSGFEKYQTELYAILGRDLKDLYYTIDITDEAFRIHAEEFSQPIQDGLFTLKYGNLNHKICIQIEKLTGARSIYTFILKHKELFLGNVIILHRKDFLESRPMLEVFQNQASVNLHRRLLEKTLSRDKFRHDPLIRETTALYAEMRIDGTLLYINPSLESISGYTNEEILGKNWWGLFQKGAQFIDIQDFLQNVKRNPIKNVETDFFTRKGYKLNVKWDWVYKYDTDSGEELLVGLGLGVNV